MGDLKGAPAVHFNFLLQSFSLYITFKCGIAASGEPIPLEYGRFGECSAVEDGNLLRLAHAPRLPASLC